MIYIKQKFHRGHFDIHNSPHLGRLSDFEDYSKVQKLGLLAVVPPITEKSGLALTERQSTADIHLNIKLRLLV